MRLPRPKLGSLIRWGGPLVLVGAWLFVRAFGDRWWPAMPLLYGPRFLLAPLLLTPLVGFIRRRGTPLRFTRRVLLPFAVGICGLLLLLDFRLPWRPLLTGGSPSGLELRVLTWNAAGGGKDPDGAAEWIFARSPQVAVISECSPRLGEALAHLPGLTLRKSADLCFLTALPILEWAPRSPEDFWKIGGAGAIARLVVDLRGEAVVIGGVHLETPRDALEGLTAGALRSFPAEATESVEERDRESAAARAWIFPIGETRPTIVMGDFNLPAESAIFRRWWGDFDDAFARVGLGLGWTKRTSQFGVRIDHILTAGGAVSTSVRVGPVLQSDHLPVQAEIVVTSSR